MANALQTALNRFTKDLEQAAELRQRIEDAKLKKFQNDLAFELAFLRSVIAWETFLEQAFFLFATGRPSLSGGPVGQLMRPKNRLAAEELVLGGRTFASWTSADVHDRASRWFADAGPFAILKSESRLAEIHTVRNRIAHGTGSAQSRFAKLCAQKHPPNIRKGMGPGRFLSHPFSKSVTESRFRRYQGVLLGTAKIICG